MSYGWSLGSLVCWLLGALPEVSMSQGIAWQSTSRIDGSGPRRVCLQTHRVTECPLATVVPGRVVLISARRVQAMRMMGITSWTKRRPSDRAGRHPTNRARAEPLSVAVRGRGRSVA